MKHAKIIGFLSVKGGVGKTTSVANLGVILAKDFGNFIFNQELFFRILNK